MSNRVVRVRGVDVPINELPALRNAIAALSSLAASETGMQVDDGSPEVDALTFLQLAARAGHPTPVSEYPKLLEEIDAAIETDTS